MQNSNEVHDESFAMRGKPPISRKSLNKLDAGFSGEHIMIAVHSRLAYNIEKYVAQWLFSNIYIVGLCEHFNFLIHQLIP